MKKIILLLILIPIAAYADGLGIGVGFSKSKPFLSSIVVATAGQSQAVQLVTDDTNAGKTAFEAEAVAAGFISATIFEASTSGASARSDSGTPTNYWFNATGPARGNAYDNFLTDVDAATTERREVTHVIWFLQGDADIANITSATITKAQYKAALEQVFAWMREDIGTHLKIIIAPYNRRTGSGADSGAQQAREAAQEIIDEQAYAYGTASFYDQDMGDDQPHLNNYSVSAERLARTIAAIEHKDPLIGTQGPYISSAVLLTDRIRATITPDAGTDYTIMSDTDYLRVDDDGADATIGSVSKINTTTFDILLPTNKGPVDGSVVTLYTNYGDGHGLAANSPGILVDNATDPLPLRQNKVTVTNGDPIQALDNLVFYMSPKASAKTFSSGSNLQTLAKLDGSIATADRLAVNYEPVYDATLFDNAGGFTNPDGSTAINYSGFSAGSTHTIGFVWKAEGPVGVIDYIFSFAVGGAADTGCRLMNSTNGAFFWFQNEAAGSTQVTPIFAAGEEHKILLEFVDGSTMNVYVDDWSTPYATLDPKNATDYEARTQIQIGAQTNATSNASLASYGSWFHTKDVLTSTEKSAISAYWTTQYNL